MVEVFGSHDNNIYALSLADGNEKWKYATGGAVAGRLLLYRDLVIALAKRDVVMHRYGLRR